jgi:hypothetical protein
MNAVLAPQNPAHRRSGQIFVRRIHAAPQRNIFRRIPHGKALPYRLLRTHLPFRPPLPNQAIWLVVGGAAIFWRNTARSGAALLAGIYFIFGIFWFPRFYTATHALGLHVPLLVSLIVGVAQQWILVAAAAMIYVLHARRDRPSAPQAFLLVRWVLGLSSIDFGCAHLTGVPEVAAMVPHWMPFGGSFWAILTGLAFVAAGVAILLEILEVAAARLLALMLFIFSALVLAPPVIAHPPMHIAWGSNAYNLTAVGAAWIFAESLVILRRQRSTAIDPEAPGE